MKTLVFYIRKGKNIAGLSLIFLLTCNCYAAGAQSEKKKFSFRDSLDHKMDLSDWIIEANGFIPVPIIITEPALGNFGLGIAPVFLKKRPPLITDGKASAVPPDVTAAAAAYTANNSWFAGGGRMASIPKYRLRYKLVAGYGDINLSYYRDIANQGEKEFGFNGKFFAGYGYLAKQFRDPKWLAGIQYLFSNIKMKMQDDSDLPDFVKSKETKSNIGELGIVVEFDSRDNIFTPDRGLKVHTHVNFSDNFFGSDYTYQRLNSFAYWFLPLYINRENGKNWISGLRVDYQQMWGDPPFFIIPSISLRGIPVMRYQGKTNILVETEQRWDFVRRWSAVVFGGLGKAFNEYSEFSDAQLVYNYGAGFRYLVARKFKVRMGIDIARGPDDWAYYIIFGSSWLKQ